MARIYFDAEPIEDERTRVGGGSAACVEVDGFAGQILQRLNFRTYEDVKFGGEQMHQVIDALVDVADFWVILEVVKYIAVDDRCVDALEIQEIMHVLEGAARHDRQDAHVGAVINHAREFDGKAQRGTFRKTGGQPDRCLVGLAMHRALESAAFGRHLCD